MNLQFTDVLISVFSLVILLIPGYILTKVGLLKEGASKAFSAFLLFACQPMLTFMSFQKCEYESNLAINMLIVAVLTLVAHFVMIGLVCLIYKLKKPNEDSQKKANIVKYASVFSNCGFMGIPFLETLFSGVNGGIYVGEVLIYAAVFNAIFNILAWTIGIYLITGDKKYISIKKALLTPTIIALIIGVAVFFIVKQPIVMIDTGVVAINTLLEKLMQAFSFLSNMVTPVAMTVLGIRLANIKFKEFFTFKGMYVSTFLKLIIAPIITIIILLVERLISGSNNLVVLECTMLFSMAMPTATNTILFCEQYDGDSESATKSMLFSTILSVITIPIIFILFKAIFKI